MTVATRLRGAFAIYVVGLVALATLYAGAVQHTAESNRLLAEIAADVSAANDRLARIDQMSRDAEKYLVTRDSRYREKFAAAFLEFGEFNPGAMRPEVLDSLRMRAAAAGVAARLTMRQQLIDAERVAGRAARASWLAAAGALILGIVLSVAIGRSIVKPLDRLALGTREIAAGRFTARLDTSTGDEFSLVARDFNAMADRLAELDRLKKDFVAKVSHDLKTPLSSMQETNSALLDGVAGPISAKQRHLIELNVEGGQRLSAMLGKLLDLSRIEAGIDPARQVVDVSEIAKRTVESASVSASRRRVRLSASVVDGSRVVGDASGLSQVLDNLVENAIKFSPVDGEVRVSVMETSRSGEVALTVADEGPGIPERDRHRVFERFYQGDAGRAVVGRGVGLGLTICREIVAAHGGRIWVGENNPRGSVFHVLLRRAVVAAAGVMLIGAAACAPFQRAPAPARPEDLELRIASLTAEVDAVRARLDSTTAVSDSLRLELQRLKEIDLKPRTPARRPPAT